jgi:hypothetical protein
MTATSVSKNVPPMSYAHVGESLSQGEIGLTVAVRNLVRREVIEHGAVGKEPADPALALLDLHKTRTGKDYRPLWEETVEEMCGSETRGLSVASADVDEEPGGTDASEEVSEPVELTEISKMNDAELLGEDHPEMQELLLKPAVFMTGDLYGQKDRRNTLDGDWQRVELPWLAWLIGEDKGKNSWGLTRHPVNKSKEGASIVLADAIDGARKDAAIKTMYAVGLDIDSGAALDDVIATLEDKELMAFIYTSHSHGKDKLVLKHDDIMRKMKLDESPTRMQIQQYLREHHKDRYDEDFIQSIEIEELRHQTTDGLRTILKTRPLDKFRVILPLWEPVELSELGATVNQWKDVWADAVCGVAVNLLGINFDATSCDVNRLYFTPRHPADADDWYAAIVQGRPLRFEEIEPYSKARYVKERGVNDDPFSSVGGDGSGEVEQFETESGINLNLWHRKHNNRWNATDVIETFCPDKIRVAGGEKAGTVHLECPFEHEHSTEGGTATMAMNPDETDAGYWTIFCRHDACNGRHKLEFLKVMVDEGWVPEEALTDEEWLIPLPDEDVSSEYEDPDDYLPASYVRGEDMIFFQSTNDDGETVNIPVCGVFEVVGRSADLAGTSDSARIISFVNENGKRVTLTISRADIFGSPKDVWKSLADQGLPLAGRDAKSEARLLDLLAGITPKRLVPTLRVPGMVRDDDDRIIGHMGPTGMWIARDGAVMRLHEDATVKDTRAKGTSEGWKGAADAALSYVEGNPYWTLELISAFGGPLLDILEWNPIGFNFSGGTGKGKTLGQLINSAAWGNPADGKGTFWGANSTPNAYEDLAVYGSGTCINIDDLGAIQDKRIIGPLIFALHSGRGKARKRGNGAGLTATAEFRPFVIFSNEHGMKSEVEAAGIPYRGGMAVRIPDVDVTHGKTRTVKERKKLEACTKNYGHAGPVFIQYLFDQNIVDDAEKLEKEVLAIVKELSKGKHHGLERAARPFALAQRAGELACDAGLLDDVEAVRKGVKLCWETFLKSDEAATANGNESLMEGFVSWVNSQMDITIIPANGIPGHEPSNSDGRGRVIGWYTDEQIIFDWKQLEAMDIPNTFGKRQALTTALAEIEALDRSSDRNIPYTSLPPEVGALPSGRDKRVKNMRVQRDRLGI